MTDEQIKRIWNRFPPEKQNMTFEDFKKELQGLSDPVQMQEDLADIQMQKAIFNTNKIRVDRAMKNDN